ncbi:MAG TPA: hypothetical protein VKA15_11620 [Isosphaeraceae bacterium]|nr:hypothetical protein [Isosphaeraceae bacterium]
MRERLAHCQRATEVTIGEFSFGCVGEGSKTLMSRNDQAKTDTPKSSRARSEPSWAEDRVADSHKERPPRGVTSRASAAKPSDRPPPVYEPEPSGTIVPAQGEGDVAEPGSVIETIVSPFHCLYQDALHFHTQSRLAQSESEASRLSRAALLLYVSSAEALVHQAAEELGRPELRELLVDPDRPLPLFDAWRILPAITAEPAATTRPLDPDSPPWPQFAELLSLRASWSFPGASSERRVYYRKVHPDGAFEPLEPHQMPVALRRLAAPEHLAFPRTGLPRDPYALRPRHLDTARGVLDAAIEALDRRIGGALTKGQRHRREPCRLVYPERRECEE